VWDGAIWRQNNTGVAFQYARELTRKLSDNEKNRIRYISSKVSFAAGVERFARSDPAFAVTIDMWDQDPWLMGTPIGTVDLRTGQLRASRPEDYITRSTAVAPAESSDCPTWQRFLDEATGNDADLIRFLRQWCGYCLTGITREHALVFVYGPGGNGKGTFLNALTGILAHYATAAAIETFTATKYDRHPTEIAALRGARAVTASETEQGRAWAEARIKQLTGGDKMRARFMRKDEFEFLPTLKLLIIGNHKPVLHSVDDAMRRRFNIVPFTRKPARPDHHLDEKLKTEWPAILRWMIEGCLDWQANQLMRPQSVLSATSDYFGEQDMIGHWLEEACDTDLVTSGRPRRRASCTPRGPSSRRRPVRMPAAKNRSRPNSRSASSKPTKGPAAFASSAAFG
jgi:putative DNA primase/helicase